MPLAPDDRLTLDLIARAAHLIRDTDALIIAAGAGMGVDSGLPDFRGNTGFWRAYPALERAGIQFEDIASPLPFECRPRLAWGFYGHRLALYRRTRPHAGFEILRRWASSKLNGAFVFSSNVDGQFQAAGFGEDRLVECHGSLNWLQCLKPCGDDIWPAARFEPDVDESACELLNEPPRCPHCGALARPNVLMFDDAGWIPDRRNTQTERLEAWLGRSIRPVVIEIGAGMAIPSVRNFSALVGRTHDAPLVRINPREAGVAPGLNLGLPLGGLAALVALDHQLS